MKYDLLTGTLVPGSCKTGDGVTADVDKQELQKEILCSVVSRVDQTGPYNRISTLHRDCGGQIFREIT